MSSIDVKIPQELEEIKEKVSLSLNKELQDLRNNVVLYIKKKIKDTNIAPKLSKELEEAVYKNTLHHTSLNEIKMLKYQIFKQRYNYRLGIIIQNITEFENKIKEKEITPDDIFNKKPIDLFPERWAEVVKRKNEEEKFLYETQLVSNSETAMCYKCKEKNVYVTYKQTRSADEPETIFYRCLTCSNKWKT